MSRVKRAAWCCVAGVAFTALMPVRCLAQDQPRDPVRLVDAKDVWRLVRHKDAQSSEQSSADASEMPYFVAAPSVTTKPSTGLLVGVSSVFAFVHGDPATTHISTVTASAKVSVKAQALTSLRFGAFSSEDGWFVQGDNRFQWTSLDIGSLGIASPPRREDLKYDWFRVYETLYRRVGTSRLFFGVGVNINDHTKVKPNDDSQVPFDHSAYVAYSAQHQFTITRQVSSGTNVGLLIDTRDNAINAQQGWLLGATYRIFFDGFLGGDSSWQELNLDVRTYRKLTRDGRQKLAWWFLGDLVTTGSAPYLDLPATSEDIYGRSARGYAEGFYRGPHMLYGEIEYRDTLVPNGLVGMVAFLNVTTLDGDVPGQKLFRSFAPAAGLGLRVLLDKHSRTNLCADYGVGIEGSRGFYLAVQEAF
jgi:outer membrane protein assembly factor BamA